MPRSVKQGYKAANLAKFVDGHIEIVPVKNSLTARWCNDVRMTADDNRRLYRWSHGEQTDVDLSTADRFLMRYDLALWEFEDWEAKRYGKSSFFDTNTLEVADV